MGDKTGERPKTEDYGSGTDSGRDEADNSALEGGEVGQFGEVGNSGVGTDLTARMEGDPRTGLVKGGEEGHEDAAGPGQYGGETGGLMQGSSASSTEGMREGGGSGQTAGAGATHGHFGGDGPNVSERPQG